MHARNHPEPMKNNRCSSPFWRQALQENKENQIIFIGFCLLDFKHKFKIIDFHGFRLRQVLQQLINENQRNCMIYRRPEPTKNNEKQQSFRVWGCKALDSQCITLDFLGFRPLGNTVVQQRFRVPGSPKTNGKQRIFLIFGCHRQGLQKPMRNNGCS